MTYGNYFKIELTSLALVAEASFGCGWVTPFYSVRQKKIPWISEEARYLNIFFFYYFFFFICVCVCVGGGVIFRGRYGPAMASKIDLNDWVKIDGKVRVRLLLNDAYNVKTDPRQN